MAFILHIETATTVCSVAISSNGKVLALREVNNGYTHSENLTVFINEVCEEAGIKLDSIDAVSISKGPGSYTGLRIGVSSAKGLCFGLDKPLIAVDTLQQMALAVSSKIKNSEINLPNTDYGKILLCPMIDARRMEVYCALFNLDNKRVKDTAAVIVDESSFKEWLADHTLVFFGDGASKCEAVLKANKNAVFIDGQFPSAEFSVALAEEAFKKRKFEDTAYFEPFYLKDFVSGG